MSGEILYQICTTRQPAKDRLFFGRVFCLRRRSEFAMSDRGSQRKVNEKLRAIARALGSGSSRSSCRDKNWIELKWTELKLIRPRTFLQSSATISHSSRGCSTTPTQTTLLEPEEIINMSKTKRYRYRNATKKRSTQCNNKRAFTQWKSIPLPYQHLWRKEKQVATTSKHQRTRLRVIILARPVRRGGLRVFTPR